MRLGWTFEALACAAIASGCFLPRGLEPISVGDAAPRDAGRDARPIDGGDCIATVPPADVCDGVDNDCDPATPDGSAEKVGLGCDGDDADLCDGGIWLCDGAGIECSDDAATIPDTCD